MFWVKAKEERKLSLTEIEDNLHSIKFLEENCKLLVLATTKCPQNLVNMMETFTTNLGNLEEAKMAGQSKQTDLVKSDLLD